MDFGIGYLPAADAGGPGELAAALEERGFELPVLEAGARRVLWWVPGPGRSMTRAAAAADREGDRRPQRRGTAVEQA